MSLPSTGRLLLWKYKIKRCRKCWRRQISFFYSVRWCFQEVLFSSTANNSPVREGNFFFVSASKLGDEPQQHTRVIYSDWCISRTEPVILFHTPITSQGLTGTDLLFPATYLPRINFSSSPPQHLHCEPYVCMYNITNILEYKIENTITIIKNIYRILWNQIHFNLTGTKHQDKSQHTIETKTNKHQYTV